MSHRAQTCPGSGRRNRRQLNTMHSRDQMLRYFFRTHLIPVALVLFSCMLIWSKATSSSEVSSAEKKGLVFGVYAHIRPTEIYKNFQPFQRYLQKTLMEKGMDTPVELKIFSTYGGAIDALAEGKVDFARFGPVSYVLAKKKSPAIRLLAMESNGGSKRFNGVIAVATHSAIDSVDDLRGKRIAFGDRRSTTGRYLAQAALVNAGIFAKDLADFSYLGRHDKVAFALAAGKYDAGSTNENTYEKYAEHKGLRKILEFPCVTKPWVARAGLNDELFVRLRDTLHELKNPEILKPIHRSGFLPAEDQDYDLIREGMLLAGRFDPESVTFGIYAAIKASDTFRMAQPVIALLEGKLAANGYVVKIRTRLFRDYAQAIDALVAGDITFGRFGPASYVLAKDRDPQIRLIAREDSVAGNPTGVFVVDAGSPIRSLNQLKGETVAFGNRHSTAGRYVAQAELLKAGIGGKDLKSYTYLGRHDRVAFAVSVGNYVAGVLRGSVYERYASAKNLRIIGQFSVPHKTWVARSGVDTDLFSGLQQALLEMRGDKALMGFGIDGYVVSDGAEYEMVRQRLESAREFE